MTVRARLVRLLRPTLRRTIGIRRVLHRIDEQVSLMHHGLAHRFPSLIRPTPRQITIAVTAACNLRCRGCRYGRDFMTGEQLRLETTRDLLKDAWDAGVGAARFYGGEPLLHRDLPAMIEYASQLGMDAYVTTNGTLLAQRIEELYAAGLRWMTIGFYGVGDDYDEYTQREGHFERLRAGLEAVRDHCGNRIEIQMNYVLTRRSCNLDALRAAWEFAREYDLHLSVDPYNDPVPFFTNPDDDLHFEEVHRKLLQDVSDELLRMKDEHPLRLPQSRTLLRALPDLLASEEPPRVPCDAYELLWVGADGTVKLCDVHFELGNVHETPLRKILFGEAHRCASRDGFQLKCPSCTCKIDSRIRKHRASLARYGR